MTTPPYTSPTLFDDVLGVPVPTLHRDGAEQRAALAAAQDPMSTWESQGYPCEECGTPQRVTNTDEGPGFYCPSCDFTTV